MYIECCPECRRERAAVCMICQLGHTTHQCPDLWRRYHLTTTDSAELTRSAAQPKPRAQLFCCNCGARGHVSFDCKALDRSKYAAARCDVFSYEDSTRFLDQVTDGGQKSIHVSSDRKSVWVVGSPPTPPQSTSRLRVLNYTFHPRDKISEKRIRSATNQVLKDVNHVDIVWRKQAKKGRIIVEFMGNGDKQEARRMFKKLVHLPGKGTSVALRKAFQAVQTPPATGNGTAAADANGDAAGSSTGVDRDSGSARQPKRRMIETVTIKYTNHENREVNCINRVCLSVVRKKSLGSLLAKLQNRHRVCITSTVVGDKWEIYIASPTGTSNPVGNNQSGQALVTINSFLQKVKNSPTSG